LQSPAPPLGCRRIICEKNYFLRLRYSLLEFLSLIAKFFLSFFAPPLGSIAKLTGLSRTITKLTAKAKAKAEQTNRDIKLTNSITPAEAKTTNCRSRNRSRKNE
jgi:hypothetical protein